MHVVEADAVHFVSPRNTELKDRFYNENRVESKI